MIEWSDEFSVKVKDMDDQHKVLIGYLNEIEEILQGGNPDRQAVDRLLVKLGAYTQDHFSQEEAYMEKIGYPGLSTHKQMHKNLIEKVVNLTQRFQSGEDVGKEICNFLDFWLRSHIKGIDIKYGNFAEEKAA